MKNIALLGILFLLVSCTQKNPSTDDSSQKKQPNFIIILADDLGYADLGCFNGAIGYSTPNLDKMATNGLKLTSLYSASPVCSPSRAGLLTGREPLRHGMAYVFFPTSWTGMSPDEVTLAEVLQQEGYHTGIVGKWHLGHHYKYLPLQQGFDEYFGIPYSNDMNGVVYMDGNDVVEENVDQRLITKTYTKKALEFIEKNQDEPFFLYLPHSMPHLPIYASENFEGKTERGLYGDVIEELDWSAGQILKKLEDLQIDDNTIVFFSSDNGPWLAFGPEAGSADPLREGKQYTFEGGMRVPGIIQWKGTIEAGSTHNGMLSFLDIMPTFTQLAGASIPNDRDYDGVDVTNILMGEGERSHDEILFSMNNEFRAFRKGDWKIKLPYPGNPVSSWKKAVAAHDTLLFNLQTDVEEQNDLSQFNRKKLSEMTQAMQSAIDQLGDLPPPLVVRPPADQSFVKRNKKRLGLD
ncbi:MAG: sulfatase [Bacteroidota bacterium]